MSRDARLEGRFARRLVAVAALSFVAMSSTQMVAFGGHGHQVNNVDHGLGSGADSNAYVHPFNDWKEAGGPPHHTIELGRSGAGYFRRVRYSGRHAHIDWDTSPRAECLFYSSHEAEPGILNRNVHPHHNYCG